MGTIIDSNVPGKTHVGTDGYLLRRKTYLSKMGCRSLRTCRQGLTALVKCSQNGSLATPSKTYQWSAAGDADNAYGWLDIDSRKMVVTSFI
jgi:hypothetical protein